MVPITEAEIKSVIQSKTKKKLPGFDEITSRILKTLASFSHPLSYFYNQLLYTCIFPAHLKFAVIKALCKKGDTSMTNW
jgi:hypothetical protein